MEKIGEIIFNLLKKSGKENLYYEGIIKIKWKNIVGEFISKNAFPDRISKRILYLKCKNPAFKQELFFLKKNIIKNINKFCDKNLIDDIRIYISNEKI